MEGSVPDFLQTVFYTEKSQMGCTMKMKGMMKSVSDKLGRYEHIRNEMDRLSHDIIQEMNEMNLFYVRHPYSETNKKAHYEDEVVNLYGANQRRLVSAGILTTNLTEFRTHKQRKEMKNEKDEVKSILVLLFTIIFSLVPFFGISLKTLGGGIILGFFLGYLREIAEGLKK